MLTTECNRLKQVYSTRARRSLEQVVEILKHQLKQINNDLDGHIQVNPLLRVHDMALRAVPGICPATTRTILVELPELGHCSPQRIAALVDVAPLNRDNSTMRGRRTILLWSRVGLERVLHGHTDGGRIHPTIHDFSWLAAGGRKYTKVPLVACCMRKQLAILYAIIGDDTVYHKILPALA